MKMHELLTDESKWATHFDALDAEGRVVQINSEAACRWCMYGAMIKCYGSTPEGFRVERTLRNSNINGLISGWNDAPGRTFQEVRDLLIRLDV